MPWALRINKFMKVIALLCVLCASVVNAQPAPAVPVDEIIRRFSTKEKEFKLARDNYIYRQNVRIQELTPDGDVRGKYEMTADVIFTPGGKRTEKVIYAPQSTLQIGFTKEDEHDIREVQPFVLTSDEIGKYDLRYLGKQKIDEIDCYLFFVRPKILEPNQRYFEGQIWVDDRDFQIVKTYGKAVPDIRKKGQENLFPRFETYREQIDGKYWFPTYTKADDTLNFSSGPQRIRIIVRYEDYKQFKATTTITFGDEVKDEKKKPEEKKPPKQ